MQLLALHSQPRDFRDAIVKAFEERMKARKASTEYNKSYAYRTARFLLRFARGFYKPEVWWVNTFSRKAS